MNLNRLSTSVVGACPLLIVAGLLYAALFVKPAVSGDSVAPPPVARGDLFYGLTAPQPDKLWAAGSDGKVWLSADQGSTWSIQRTPVNLTLQDIAAWDKAHAVAVGDDGVVIRTTDGGQRWERVSAPRSTVANKLMRVFVQPGGDAWAIGEMGMVLHSVDFGANWKQVAPEEDAAWNGVHAAGRNVWLVGEFGRIAFTADGGETWTKVDSPASSSLMAVAFRNDTDGVAVGLEGAIYRTADGGRHWTALPKKTTEHLFDVTWDGQRWAVVGDKGLLLVGDAAAASWEVRRVAEGDRQWHTRVLHSGSHYIVAGGSLQKPAVN